MQQNRGFSLIEMAFVLVIITLLLGGLLVPFATQVEQRRIAETQKAMEEIKEALIGYALSHSSTGTPSQPYLPCPDTNGDGTEETRDGSGNCPNPGLAEGELPWVTLGTAPTDAWGNRFHYQVTKGFANSVTGFGLASPAGDITICNMAPSAGCALSNRLATSIPAVVLSYGKNGYGALNGNTPATVLPQKPSRNPIAAAGLDETANLDAADAIFVSRIITGPGAGLQEFDDLVIWLSPNVLYNRMVSAGRLP